MTLMLGLIGWGWLMSAAFVLALCRAAAGADVIAAGRPSREGP